MKYIAIQRPAQAIDSSFSPILPASKSISNRLLILQYHAKQRLKISNISAAGDTRNLEEILNKIAAANSDSLTFSISEGGTTLRFLLPLLAFSGLSIKITVGELLRNRPIIDFINVLNSLGAAIKYHNPLITIEPATVSGETVVFKQVVSSQFLSALILNAPLWINGLKITLHERPPSFPYLKMSIDLSALSGTVVEFTYPELYIHPPKTELAHVKFQIGVENDWSAAAYWYAWAALVPHSGLMLDLPGDSHLQGDRVIRDYFRFFGVSSNAVNGRLHLTHKPLRLYFFETDAADIPDQIQTLAVTGSLLRIPMILHGAQTLRVKETDRIAALKSELRKMGTQLQEEPTGTLVLTHSEPLPDGEITFESYGDHRMAMAFSLCASRFNKIIITNPGVVNKSYPGYWDELQRAGFFIEKY